MSITVHNLLSRPKLDRDMGYDTAVKGASVVVRMRDAPFTSPAHAWRSRGLARVGTPVQPRASARLPAAPVLKRPRALAPDEPVAGDPRLTPRSAPKPVAST
jgi:hypothetical protein